MQSEIPYFKIILFHNYVARLIRLFEKKNSFLKCLKAALGLLNLRYHLLRRIHLKGSKLHFVDEWDLLEFEILQTPLLFVSHLERMERI
jgi:hypothetical protein